jgi:uncharacterized protein YdaU (DUF1376 family)
MKKQRLPWRKDWVADEDAATAHLSCAELGAYERLRRSYWINGGLPNDESRLASIARISLEQMASISLAVKPMFGPDWRSEKLDAELEHGRKGYETRAKSGRLGGLAKSRNSSICSSNARAKLYQSESEAASASESDFGHSKEAPIALECARTRSNGGHILDEDDDPLDLAIPF